MQMIQRIQCRDVDYDHHLDIEKEKPEEYQAKDIQTLSLDRENLDIE